MSWSVNFFGRAFQNFVAPHGTTFLPRRYSWHALGGPDWAEVTVSSAPMDVWRLLGWLRYGVEIRNQLHQRVWWGYVESVSITVGAIRIGVSLETMHNRVAVVYSYVEPSTQSVGTRATTTWAQDDESVAAYGIKEVLTSIDGATVEQAENARDVHLAQNRLPVPMPDTRAGDDLEAQLFCRGWWDTLNWRYYANGATNSVETTQQIADMVNGAGQFFSGVDIMDSSGVLASEYRDGDGTAQDELVNLLRTGTSAGQRLLATVTPERFLRVYREPSAANVALHLTTDGRISDRVGNPLPDGVLPVGRWLALKDVIPGTALTAHLASPSPFFVERAEYDVEGGHMTLEPRGLPSVWELARIGIG